ncbi:PLDc N-terminal domain-containing protein [Arcticibacter tournemirensis]|uniref:PLDc_N domain-containing protein n=1 Tax=Arcticibacter tournemirensis TaxID=699437 RepID=A0A4Q0M7M6_9SPHI|nr:PLDc_N domain-containing protein [Arcticibacter tournemirensis]
MNTLLFLNIGASELLIVALLPLILMIFCLVDVLRSDFKDRSIKPLWCLVIILAPFFGSLIYLLVGRNQKIRYHG